MVDEIKEGSTVQRKTGGPVMKVDVLDGSKAVCSLAIKGKQMRREVELEDLKLVPRPAPPGSPRRR